jgi:hypothetical protein
VNPLKSFCAPGSTEMAEADIAAETNFLREYFPFTFMVSLSATSLRSGAHIIAQQRPDAAAALSQHLSQYFFPTKFP